MANSISSEPPFLLLSFPFLSQRAKEEEEEGKRGFLFLLRFQKAEMNGNSLPRFLFGERKRRLFSTPCFQLTSPSLFGKKSKRERVPLCYVVSREQLSTIIMIHP